MKNDSFRFRISEAEKDALRRKAGEKGLSVSAFICEALGLADPRQKVLAYVKGKLADPRYIPLVDRALSDSDIEGMILESGELNTEVIDRETAEVRKDIEVFIQIHGGNKTDYTKAANNELLEADLYPDRETEPLSTNDKPSDDPTDYTKAANNELLESDLILKRETE